MPFLLWVTLLGLFTGVVGTAAGGLAAAVIKRPSRDMSSAMLGFAGGVMLAIIALDLLPEATRRGGLVVASLGLLLGAGLIYALDAVLPHVHPNPEDRESRRHAGRDAGRDPLRLTRMSLLIGLGVALHNLPEGVAIGSGYASGAGFGFAVTALIFFQNVPEGVAVAAPYIIAGRSRLRAIGVTALVGLPEPVGALIGAVVASLSSYVLAFTLAFAGGAMLFIVGDELLPGALELSGNHTLALGLVAGVLTGMVLSTLLTGV